MRTWEDAIGISRGTASKITPVPPLSLDFWSADIEAVRDHQKKWRSSERSADPD